jgi:hypothetical protein
VAHCAGLEEVAAIYEEWLDKRNQINYEVDGLVVKIDDRPLAGSLGFVGKDPRGTNGILLRGSRKNGKLTSQVMSVRAIGGRVKILGRDILGLWELSPHDLGHASGEGKQSLCPA